jgi:hypothetical protein
LTPHEWSALHSLARWPPPRLSAKRNNRIV